MFDIKNLLAKKGINTEIKDASILTLLSSSRPLDELLKPNHIDQEAAMVNQFQGMASVDFSYEDFVKTRLKLVESINDSFTTKDKEFFIDFHEANPNWDMHDLSLFPAIKWKLQNVMTFKTSNPMGHAKMMQNLHAILGVGTQE